MSIIILSRNLINNDVKIKGVAITLSDANNNDVWYDKNLPKIKKLGATLQVVTVVTVKSSQDPVPINDPEISEKLDRLFRKCDEYGVKVSFIKPHLMTTELGDSFRRYTYHPNEINKFFEEWEKIMSYYAWVSKQNDVPLLSISCETAYLSQNIYVLQWQSIINKIKLINPDVKVTMPFTKSEFDRELTYHEQGKKSVSTLLDYISLNMYPVVKRDTISEKIKVSDEYFAKTDYKYGFIEGIKRARQYFDKDILISETGAVSRSDQAKEYIPAINLNPNNPLDHINQDQWVKVVLGIILQMDDVKGVYIWHVNYPFNFLDSPTEKTIKHLFEQY
ncbi:hypothetical protein [Priestia aryabhattai]|uniref:hypothetical protein n=1 Tax=Priestia aryabhattai TaxID=412384 RepID=UPI0023AF6AE5|nr:hypothetical protein [Priestia aryabhattai]MDE8675366.1 hypothetical protein [Priestia aryabhattai]